MILSLVRSQKILHHQADYFLTYRYEMEHHKGCESNQGPFHILFFLGRPQSLVWLQKMKKDFFSQESTSLTILTLWREFQKQLLDPTSSVYLPMSGRQKTRMWTATAFPYLPPRPLCWSGRWCVATQNNPPVAKAAGITDPAPSAAQAFSFS